jgi:hypothetical protein
MVLQLGRISHSQSEVGKSNLVKLEADHSCGSWRHGLLPEEEGVLEWACCYRTIYVYFACLFMI